MKRRKLNEAIFDAIYQQSRVNRSLGKIGDVDLFASRTDADAFHTLLVRRYPQYHDGTKGDMRWKKTKLRIMPNTVCRTYSPAQVCYPLCTVHVIILPGDMQTILMLDYAQEAMKDLITGRRRPFPPWPQ